MIRRLSLVSRVKFSPADGSHDEPTADPLIRRMQSHEKTAWMLRSLLDYLPIADESGARRASAGVQGVVRVKAPVAAAELASPVGSCGLARMAGGREQAQGILAAALGVLAGYCGYRSLCIGGEGNNAGLLGALVAQTLHFLIRAAVASGWAGKDASSLACTAPGFSDTRRRYAALWVVIVLAIQFRLVSAGLR